jgi:hypothetical protein
MTNAFPARLPRVGARPLSVRVVALKGDSFSASTWQRLFTHRFCGAAPASHITQSQVMNGAVLFHPISNFRLHFELPMAHFPRRSQKLLRSENLLVIPFGREARSLSARFLLLCSACTKILSLSMSPVSLLCNVQATRPRFVTRGKENAIDMDAP